MSQTTEPIVNKEDKNSKFSASEIEFMKKNNIQMYSKRLWKCL